MLNKKFDQASLGTFSLFNSKIFTDKIDAFHLIFILRPQKMRQQFFISSNLQHVSVKLVAICKGQKPQSNTGTTTVDTVF